MICGRNLSLRELLNFSIFRRRYFNPQPPVWEIWEPSRSKRCEGESISVKTGGVSGRCSTLAANTLRARSWWWRPLYSLVLLQRLLAFGLSMCSLSLLADCQEGQLSHSSTQRLYAGIRGEATASKWVIGEYGACRHIFLNVTLKPLHFGRLTIAPWLPALAQYNAVNRLNYWVLIPPV